ncbi:hypothetical protein [Comamonas composti]|uniref:hypothetical protein n=1 Tax=Comamonas composti TaxID=408558 RepID=UPI0012EB2E85|nr:hypothetical protein [Comamonas composti]
MSFKNISARNDNYHCILVVESNDCNEILQAMLPKRVKRMKIKDRDSPEEMVALAKKYSLGFPALSIPFRYSGILSSSGFVKGPNLLAHIEWIFSNFKPEFKLTEWSSSGASYELSFAWWGGLGTAYGPMISPELADILTKHRIPLEISIY